MPLVDVHAGAEVDVVVVEPGYGRASGQVGRIRSRVAAEDVFVGPDRDDTAVSDGHGLGVGQLGVEGDDVAAVEDGVHGYRRWGTGRGRQSHRQGQGRSC